MVREPDFVDECYADKDLSLLKKLTLVIPTFNRAYLSRCLWYHAHFSYGQIIVADSSFDEKKIENRNIIKNIRDGFGIDILHLEYKPETEKYGGDIYRKWGDAVQHVQTEYSQIVTDKEFTVPTTQCECIEYLDKHKDYVCISGKYYSYVISSSGGIIQNKYNNRRSIDDDDALTRYISSLSAGWKQSTFMSLFRSSVQKEIYLPVLSSTIKDLRFGERYLEFAGYVIGKVCYQNDVTYNIRDISKISNDSENNSKESSTLRYPQMRNYNKKSECYLETYAGFKYSIANLLVKYGGYNEKTMDKIWNLYISPQVTRDALGISNRKYLLIRILCSIIPHDILQFRQRKKYGINPDLESKIIMQVIDTYSDYTFNI